MVHEAAGLAKVDIFRVLGVFGDFHSVHRTAVVGVAQDRAHQHFKGSGRRKAGTLEHIGGGVGVQSPDFVALLNKTGGHAADQGDGFVVLLGLYFQVAGFDGVHLVAFGFDADQAAVIGGDHGDDIQIDAGGDNPAVVVVGVVAGDFGAAGSGEKSQVFAVAVKLGESVHRFTVAGSLGGNLVRAVKAFQLFVQPAGGNPFF